MSQENVEIVHKANEAYNADTEAYLDFIAEDVEVYPDASRFPEATPFRGRDQFRRFLADIDQSWESGARAEIREVFPVDDRVVVRADWGGTGQASGIDMLSSLTVIYTIRDGQIIKIEYFFDHAKALEAAGLSE
jgi:ketosteroid isomerase-like protein